MEAELTIYDTIFNPLLPGLLNRRSLTWVGSRNILPADLKFLAIRLDAIEVSTLW